MFPKKTPKKLVNSVPYKNFMRKESNFTEGEIVCS